MGLLIGVGGIMQELRRVRSGIQSEQVRKAAWRIKMQADRLYCRRNI
jgi:hypothetical protein